MEIEYYRNNLLTKVIYWNKCNLSAIDSYLDNVDTLEMLYPVSVSDDIYGKYKDIMSFIEDKGKWGDETHSLEINLNLSDEEILRMFGKTCIYKVRRADTRDELRLIFIDNPTIAELERYYEFYDCFAETKNRSKIERERVKAFADEGMFNIAEICDKHGKILVTHGYIVDRQIRKVSLYTSSSLFRNDKENSSFVSRANRLLHYKSMLNYKKKGFEIYDMGGLYLGKENQELSKISSFKKSFGGTVVDYKCSFVIHKEEARIIEKELERYLDVIHTCDVVIWGATWRGIFVNELLESKYEKKPKYFIDNRLSQNDDKYVSEYVLAEINASKTLLIVTTSAKSYSDIISKPIVHELLVVNRVVAIN